MAATRRQLRRSRATTGVRSSTATDRRSSSGAATAACCCDTAAPGSTSKASTSRPTCSRSAQPHAADDGAFDARCTTPTGRASILERRVRDASTTRPGSFALIDDDDRARRALASLATPPRFPAVVCSSRWACRPKTTSTRSGNGTCVAAQPVRPTASRSWCTRRCDCDVDAQVCTTSPARGLGREGRARHDVHAAPRLRWWTARAVGSDARRVRRRRACVATGPTTSSSSSRPRPDDSSGQLLRRFLRRTPHQPQRRPVERDHRAADHREAVPLVEPDVAFLRALQIGGNRFGVATREHRSHCPPAETFALPGRVRCRVPAGRNAVPRGGGRAWCPRRLGTARWRHRAGRASAPTPPPRPGRARTARAEPRTRRTRVSRRCTTRRAERSSTC